MTLISTQTESIAVSTPLKTPKFQNASNANAV